MAYNPITGSDDYFDPNDPNVLSGDDSLYSNVMGSTPPTMPTQSVTLGGKQDGQKEYSKNGLQTSSPIPIPTYNPMYAMNPYSSVYGNTYSGGRRGLGVLDPMLQVEKNIMEKNYDSAWGAIPKAMAGAMMGNELKSYKDQAAKAMMEQQSSIASILGSGMSDIEKGQALLASGIPAAQKLGTSYFQKARMQQTQENQDRSFDLRQTTAGIQREKFNQEKEDVKAIGERMYRTGIADTSQLYRMGGKVQAYLERAHPDFDFNGARYKSMAIQQQIRSLNAPQQTRLHQAISSVEQSIPEMQRLNEAFNRTGIVPLNKLIIGVRKNENGAFTSDLKANTKGMTPDQVKIAQQFITQMNIMRDETAQVFSGGYAPTEAAFHLADQVLNPFYGANVTEAGLEQLGTNLRIRRSALSDVQASIPNFNAETGSAGGHGTPSVEGQVPSWASRDPKRYEFAKSRGHSDDEIKQYFSTLK